MPSLVTCAGKTKISWPGGVDLVAKTKHACIRWVDHRTEQNRTELHTVERNSDPWWYSTWGGGEGGHLCTGGGGGRRALFGEDSDSAQQSQLRHRGLMVKSQHKQIQRQRGHSAMPRTGNDLGKGSIGGEELGYKGPGSQTTQVKVFVRGKCVHSKGRKKWGIKKVLIRNEDA